MTIFPPAPILEPPEFEYKVVPEAELPEGESESESEKGLPLIWEDLKYIDIEDTIAGEGVQLVGYRVYCRCYQIQITETPDGEIIRTKVQVPYTITDSTLVIVDPESPLFINQIDPPATPPEETTLFGFTPGDYLAGVWAEGGIRDLSTYDYYRVFDEAQVSWLPRASSIEQQYISPKKQGLHYPYEPALDENRPRPKYTMDTISSWLPDERELVKVTFGLTTNATSVGYTLSEQVAITQTVFQDMGNMVGKLKKVLNRCYFTHGLYHNGLYFNESSRNYNVQGRVRTTAVPIYDVDDFLVRTDSFNDDGDLTSTVREPIYPLLGELEPVIENGELVRVDIINPGLFYPKNFVLKFRDVNWFTADGEVPMARAVVAPMERGEPVEVEVPQPDGSVSLEMREGRLTGGQITEVEIIKPGSQIRKIGSVAMGNRDLSNNVYDYKDGFSNTRSMEPSIPVEERTPND